MSAWPIYTGVSEPHDGIESLPSPPNWRSFDGGPVLPAPPPAGDGTHDPTTQRRLGLGNHHREPGPHEIQMINAALFLRRPLLITGNPGTGKSTIAYMVAKELKLGSVLRWPITSRSTLREGLYRYDPIGRLREEKQWQDRGHTGAPAVPTLAEGIGRHVRLGPLGTALLPYAKPRVLLIDEIDKSDIDLPNDLLNVFEEGEYDIDELAQLPEEASTVQVMTADPDSRVDIHRGHVRCHAFPFVVLTSNAEREFPPAFLRRCLRLDLLPPDPAQLTAIITAHLGSEAAAAADRHVRAFLAKRERAEVTTDQLLNAVYLATSGHHDGRSPEEVIALDEVINAVMRPLTGSE